MWGCVGGRVQWGQDKDRSPIADLCVSFAASCPPWKKGSASTSFYHELQIKTSQICTITVCLILYKAAHLRLIDTTGHTPPATTLYIFNLPYPRPWSANTSHFEIHSSYDYIYWTSALPLFPSLLSYYFFTFVVPSSLPHKGVAASRPPSCPSPSPSSSSPVSKRRRGNRSKT